MKKGAVADIKSGDIEAFEQLFNDYCGQLCAHAYTLLHDADDAEEMVQNVFVNFWNKRATLTISGSPKSYLYKAVKNESLNFIKHKKVVDLHATGSQHITLAQAQDPLVLTELQEKIDQVLAALPPERKKIFLMNRNEGLKYREIAVKLNISIKTVENQMGSALKFLRNQLVDYISVMVLILSEWLNIC